MSEKVLVRWTVRGDDHIDPTRKSSETVLVYTEADYVEDAKGCGQPWCNVLHRYRDKTVGISNRMSVLQGEGFRRVAGVWEILVPQTEWPMVVNRQPPAGAQPAPKPSVN